MAPHPTSEPFERHIQALRDLLISGAMPLNAFLDFLRNPRWEGADDELRATYRLAKRSGVQDRATILWYIARASGDSAALNDARRNWEEAGQLHEDTREEIGKYTVLVLTAFQCYAEALMIARSLPHAKDRFRALRTIYRAEPKPEILEEVRRAIDEEAGAARVQMLLALAAASKDPQHLLLAAEELRALSASPHRDFPWLCASQVMILANAGQIPAAKKALVQLTHADAYRTALAVVAEASKDPKDSVALAVHPPSEKLKPNLTSVDALLAIKHIEIARRFAQAIKDPAMGCSVSSRISYHALGSAEDFDAAERWYPKLSDQVTHAVHITALMHFAWALHHQGRTKEARATADRVTSNTIRARALMGIFANKSSTEFLDPFTHEEF